MTEAIQDLIAIVLTEPVMMDGKTLKPGTELEVEPELWAELQKWNAAELKEPNAQKNPDGGAEGAAESAGKEPEDNGGTDAGGSDASTQITALDLPDDVQQALAALQVGEDYTGSGKPKVEALERELGREVSATQRDTWWDLVLDHKESTDTQTDNNPEAPE